LTVNVWPPIVRLPLRAGPPFALTLKVMLLLPVPEGELVSVTHSAVEAAVHVHEPPVVSVIVPAPPVASNDWLVGESA
jgi:hypothetical protein